MDLTNASALVTGGAGGFGSATARRLAQKGAKVVIADVADARGEALAKELGNGSVYVRTDRIKSPADLRGCRVGVPEYQLTANIWVRLFLEEDYGIRPSDITWVRGGYEHPGRIEKINLNLPSDVIVENAPADATISDLLASGELDAVIGPRAPSCFDRGHPNVGYLFADPQATATAWRTSTTRGTRAGPISDTSSRARVASGAAVAAA